MHAPSYGETDGGDELGMASSADGVRKGGLLITLLLRASSCQQSKFQDRGLAAS